MTPVVAITDPIAPAGRANARSYAEAGWNVALLGRGWGGLEAAAADVRALGRDVLVLPIDLTDPAARALAIERIQSELGPITAWTGGERSEAGRTLRQPHRSWRARARRNRVPIMTGAVAAGASLAIGLVARRVRH